MRWNRSGVWEKVLQVLSQDADNEYVMLDATIVRACQRHSGRPFNGRVMFGLGRAVIPSLRNRKHRRDYDKDVYRKRHLIENFFTHLKQYRALATGYDKTAAAIYLAAAVSWIK